MYLSIHVQQLTRIVKKIHQTIPISASDSFEFFTHYTLQFYEKP